MKKTVARSSLLSSRAVAETTWGSGDAHVQSIATRRPRSQAIGARGAPHLPFGFASKPSPSARWARGLLSAFWERGSPDLPACGPRRGSTSGPVQPIFTNKHSRPSRGGRHKTSSGAASSGWLARGGEIKARRTSRGSNDASHDDQDQAGASTHSVLASSLVLRRQAQARSTKASSKGFHIGATRPRPARRRSPWSPRRRHHQSLWQAKTTFSQDSLY